MEGGIRTRSFNDGARSSDGGCVDGSSSSSSDVSDPVLSPIHVSCYVTAANRATPVFEVLPQQNCVRVVSKPTSDPSSGASAGGGTTTGMLSTGKSTTSGGAVPLAEWELNSVFSSSSPSHAIDFFTEVTLPALRSARDGINANIIVWGVHPTQKFRLLFGKSVGGGGFAPQPEMAVKDVVELYGQLVGMLHAFFSQLDLGPANSRSQDQSTEPWRLGVSSWIIVNNQTIDLLKTPGGATSTSPQATAPVSFVSLEAPSLASAFRIVQTAKTNRIVQKHNAESVHFFVRLALFHGGQVSTLHLVDLVDQKDFQDQVLIQEKIELYNILQGLRLPLPSPRQSGSRLSIPGSGAASPTSGKMVLSNFMLPLLTANARTFLYANVIDSRTSLRESVQMLNAVANLRGFTCVCKRLRGVSYEQLGFQTSLSELDQQEPSSQDGQTEQRIAPEARNTNPIAPPSYPAAQPPLNSQHAGAFASMLQQQSSLQQASTTASTSTQGDESEAMSWLDAFTQRKRDILGGSIDSVPTVPALTLSTRVAEAVPVDTRLMEALHNRDDLQRDGATPEVRSSFVDLYERLRESLDEVNEIDQPTTASPRASYCSLHSLPPDPSVPEIYTPLPIVDKVAHRDITQDGYSRNTIGGLTRHQPQQFMQQADELSMWTLSNNAASNQPIDFTSHRYRNDVDTLTPSTGPEESSLQPAELSPSPFSLASPIDSPLSSQLPPRADSRTLEAFKKAGVPACVMEPPKLDGLDDKTAQKIQAADATLLRKNYDALLSIVREQQQAKEAAEARAAEALHDQEEQRAMFEVQIENMKLANVGLRSKVRALENRTSLPQVFEQYEHELRTLHGQVQELQTRNVALELRASGFDGIGGASVGLSGSSDMKRKYQQVVEERNELEREVMEHRRRERHHQVHSRLAGESTRRVDQLSRDLNNKEEDLVATRLSKKRLSAEMNQALEKADQLHHENEKLLQEKVATTEELLATRMYLASLENEKKKASILDRFVEKHGDRMNKLRQSGQSSQGTKGESWRRDQYARECEDKLLASVKRSLPQAVPLCNKLLRRLEMQELSLREFSEREVDFINLLVELVSDQPAVSLKKMIEQEMKKLQSC